MYYLLSPRPISSEALVSTDAPPPLLWKWRRFGTTYYVVTLSGGVPTLGAAILKPSPSGLFYRGIGFDEPVRNVSATGCRTKAGHAGASAAAVGVGSSRR